MSRRDSVLVVVAALCAAGWLWLARPLSYEVLASVLLGAAIGAVVTGAISWHFYRQASDDQKAIRDSIFRMLQTMSGGGRVEGIQDEQGEFTGDVAHYIEVSEQLDTTDSVQDSKPSGESPKPGG